MSAAGVQMIVWYSFAFEEESLRFEAGFAIAACASTWVVEDSWFQIMSRRCFRPPFHRGRAEDCYTSCSR